MNYRIPEKAVQLNSQCQYYNELWLRLCIKQTAFCLIILTPTGDRNGSHVRLKFDINLFIVSDYWKNVSSFRRYHVYKTIALFILSFKRCDRKLDISHSKNWQGQHIFNLVSWEKA